MLYQVPPSTTEKEKILGGLLTLSQTAWIAGGLVLAAGVFFFGFTVLALNKAALFLAFPFLFTGVPFAFMKDKHSKEIPLFTYFVKKHQFNNSIKKLPNYRKESKF